jgi:hypothetical protein
MLESTGNLQLIMEAGKFKNTELKLDLLTALSILWRPTAEEIPQLPVLSL